MTDIGLFFVCQYVESFRSYALLIDGTYRFST